MLFGVFFSSQEGIAKVANKVGKNTNLKKKNLREKHFDLDILTKNVWTVNLVSQLFLHFNQPLNQKCAIKYFPRNIIILFITQYKFYCSLK